MGLRFLWWPTLYVLLHAVCEYWNDNKDKMPDDLPAPVTAALDAIELACAALRAYDVLKKRGVNAYPEDDGDTV